MALLAGASLSWPQDNRGTNSAKRIPWTTSKLTGSPEAPPPYRTERVFSHLKFDQPVVMTRAPGMERWFVAELEGKVFSFANSTSPASPSRREKAEVFLDLSKIDGHFRTYGLTFHPDFARNRYIYACYVLKKEQPKGTRVSRFTVSSMDPPRVDPASEVIILEWPSGGHNGGCLEFGPDGYLYIATGDGTSPSPPDGLNTGQDISDLLGSILRIDVNRPSDGARYAIPKDNPFLTTPGARPEVWAYGLRNPWKIAFDRKTGYLWCGDVGWEMWEMIYRIERGGNYGWSVVEGSQPVKPELKRGPTPIIPPVIEHPHIESRSITGGRVYHGSRLPELKDVYIYGDYVTGKLWGLRYDGTKVTWQQHLADSPLQVIDFADDAQGELYVVCHSGEIHRLVPNPSAKANKDFPRKLSETGLFASTKNHQPAPGVVPYGINAEPWIDHGKAERLFAVPGSGTLGVYEKQNLQIGHVKGAWIYPNDTVFAKTISLELERGKPATARRLETQILHQDRGTWRAYNYIWNDDQTDATLADPDGFDRIFNIKEPTGDTKQTWHFASRTECLVCHTTRAGSILGFNTAQLNSPPLKNGGQPSSPPLKKGGAPSSPPLTKGGQGRSFLHTLDDLGFFEQPLPHPLPRLPKPTEPNETLTTRARAYLHTNCAHCHRRGGGGTAPFELLFDLDLKRTLLIGSRPSQGTFEIPGAANVLPGDPYRSVLYYRMAKLGPGRMPHLGSNVIDTRGLDLVHEWIRSLPQGDAHTSAELEECLQTLCSEKQADWPKASARLLSSPPSALFLLRAMDCDKLSPEACKQVLAVAKTSPAHVRDLFERFIPEHERIRRLGSVVKPKEILALQGDVSRGREMFFKSASSQCRNCHRIQGEGQEIGPDLSQIGKKYDRAQLLESILQPSRKIDAAFQTYLVETNRGSVYSGLLIKNGDQEVALKDAQGKVIAIPKKQIEILAPQPQSLMPELLTRDMTAQELADLLEFLAGLK